MSAERVGRVPNMAAFMRLESAIGQLCGAHIERCYTGNGGQVQFVDTIGPLLAGLDLKVDQDTRRMRLWEEWHAAWSNTGGEVQGISAFQNSKMSSLLLTGNTRITSKNILPTYPVLCYTFTREGGITDADLRGYIGFVDSTHRALPGWWISYSLRQSGKETDVDAARIDTLARLAHGAGAMAVAAANPVAASADRIGKEITLTPDRYAKLTWHTVEHMEDIEVCAQPVDPHHYGSKGRQAMLVRYGGDDARIVCVSDDEWNSHWLPRI